MAAAELAALLLILFLVSQRVSELVAARRNRRLLEARNPHEAAGRQMWLFIPLHAGFLVALPLELYAAGVRWSAWSAAWLALFIAAQALRVWSKRSLGIHWNTRIYVHPGMQLVRRGPYRWIRHPNYLAVILEFLCLPMTFSAWRSAVLFSLANALLLTWRIRAEERALRRQIDPQSWEEYRKLPRFLPRWRTLFTH